MVAKRTVKLLIQWLSFLLGLSLPFGPSPSHNDALLQPTPVALGSLAHFKADTTWLRLAPGIKRGNRKRIESIIFPRYQIEPSKLC